MEAIWDCKGESITSGEILKWVLKRAQMSDRTERVLLHHLVRKGLVGYTVDEHDSRVYHYFAKCSKEECLNVKRESFIDIYYGGNRAGAAASFLQGLELSEADLKELEKIIKSRKKNG